MAERLRRVRPEREQTAVTVFHDEFAFVPGHVGNASSEFDATRGVVERRLHVYREELGHDLANHGWTTISFASRRRATRH